MCRCRDGPAGRIITAPGAVREKRPIKPIRRRSILLTIILLLLLFLLLFLFRFISLHTTFFFFSISFPAPIDDRRHCRCVKKIVPYLVCAKREKEKEKPVPADAADDPRREEKKV